MIYNKRNCKINKLPRKKIAAEDRILQKAILNIYKENKKYGLFNKLVKNFC